MSDAVTEPECRERQDTMHGRINQRATWKLVLWVLGFFFVLITGSYGYTSVKVTKVEDRQWEFQQNMVTKKDFSEFKTEMKAEFSQIQTSIESLRRP